MNAFPSETCDRIWHYGGACGGWKLGACLIGKHHSHRGDPRGFDHCFWPISSAQINPAVTLCFWLYAERKRQEALFYLCGQIVGGILGVFAAHMMFDHALIDPSTTMRSGLGQWIGEFIATFGLIGTILICVTLRPAALAMSVGLYIT